MTSRAGRLVIDKLSGVAHPTRKMRALLKLARDDVNPRLLDGVVEDSVAIDSFARLLTEAMEKCQTKDGRVDMKDVAAFVLGEMRKHQL